MSSCGQKYTRSTPGNSSIPTRSTKSTSRKYRATLPGPSIRAWRASGLLDRQPDDQVLDQGLDELLVVAQFFHFPAECIAQPRRLVDAEFVLLLEIEGFIQRLGKRMGRVALQKPISVIRHFLRFLAASGAVPQGLDSQIDTPRVYRQEQLPRALPWTIVEAFLHSIDRNTSMGKRDYAMFSLMATYGLRACDVVALKLDDIKWRSGCIRICQTKTGNPLDLPFTNQVSSALYDYLKKIPRYGEYRQVFLRLRAPGGALKPTAVIEAFQAWSRKSGLDIPFQGTYCLRHSYALHLFHHGLPLKTIGDLLRHRSPESTAVYIRLVTEDLRVVPLHVPAFTERQEEVGS